MPVVTDVAVPPRNGDSLAYTGVAVNTAVAVAGASEGVGESVGALEGSAVAVPLERGVPVAAPAEAVGEALAARVALGVRVLALTSEAEGEEEMDKVALGLTLALEQREALEEALLLPCKERLGRLVGEGTALEVRVTVEVLESVAAEVALEKFPVVAVGSSALGLRKGEALPPPPPLPDVLVARTVTLPHAAVPVG